MTPAGAGRAVRPAGVVDRRLFGFAGGTWGASLCALHAAPGTSWAAAGAAMSAVGVLVGLHHVWLRRSAGAAPSAPSRYRPRHRRPVGVWALAAVLLGAVCGFAATAARTTARDGSALVAVVREHPAVQVELVIRADPRPLRAPAAIGREQTTLLVPARLTRIVLISGDRLELDVRVLVFARDPAWGVLLPSQVVGAQGRLAPSRGGDLTAAVLSADGPPAQLSDPQWTQSAAGALRAGLRSAVGQLPAKPGGLLPGLAIGDTSLLDPRLEEDFRTTGLTHLTAVSGANITIVIGFVLLLARWARAGPWVAAAFAVVALTGFVILARPSPSVLRAAAMGVVGLLALVVGRSRVATAALATAVVGSLLIDPGLAVDVGFLLSVLATGALVLLAPRWRDRLRTAGVPPGLAEALAVPAAAQVACAPVIAAVSGQVSLVALPANLLAAPAVAPVTVLGVVAAAVSPVWPAAAGVLAWVACWPARWLVLVAHAGASVPVASLDWLSGWRGALSLAAVIAAAWLAARHPRARVVALVLVLAAGAGALPIRWLPGGWPPAGAVVVACDVGQGDAIVLPDADGSAVVVDAGPDPEPVDACLRRLGVSTVDVIVISHFHADHIGGLDGVLAGRAVGAIVVPTFDEPDFGEAQVRATAQAHTVPVVEVGAGWSFRGGEVELVALAPDQPLVGTRSDPNNNSLVLLARVRGIAILLLGDAEVEQQVSLLRDADPSDLRVEILKVAHHGSSYQDLSLIAATGARVALVSAGAGNSYGHPHPALLGSLAEAGMTVLRTDEHGDVAVVLTTDGLGVVASRGRA